MAGRELTQNNRLFMPRPRFALRLALGLGLTLIGAPAWCQTDAANASPASTRALLQRHAVIVLIGALANDAELSALLRELLETSGVVVELATADHFERRDLLEARPSQNAVYVFVAPAAAGATRLYFRAPDRERFLLRRLPERPAFDDVAREQIGQTVQTAVDSLSRSNEGLTREQARAALDVDDKAPAADASPAKASRAAPEPVRESSRRAAGHAAPSSTLEGWLGVRYAATLLTTKVGPAHGPALELGLGIAGSRLALRARGTIEDDFRQTATTSAVGAELHSYRLRLSIDAGLLLGHEQRLLASIGAGQDRTSVSPLPTLGGVTPHAAFIDLAPVGHAELRYELGSGIARAAAALGADLSLVDTHFDVERDAQRTRVLSWWLLRPTFGVAVALVPRWAIF